MEIYNRRLLRATAPAGHIASWEVGWVGRRAVPDQTSIGLFILKMLLLHSEAFGIRIRPPIQLGRDPTKHYLLYLSALCPIYYDTFIKRICN